MIAHELLSENLVKQYFLNISINKDIMNKIFLFISNNELTHGEQSKLFYLLYNEYISICDIVTDEENYNTEMLSMYEESLKVPYTMFRTEYFRKYVSTLDLNNYYNKQNIEAQISLIEASLPEYIVKLKNIFGNDVSLKDFVRYPSLDNSNQIQLSRVESDSRLLNIAASIINNTHTNEQKEMITCDQFKFVLNKIYNGTIH